MVFILRLYSMGFDAEGCAQVAYGITISSSPFLRRSGHEFQAVWRWRSTPGYHTSRSGKRVPLDAYRTRSTCDYTLLIFILMAAAGVEFVGVPTKSVFDIHKAGKPFSIVFDLTNWRFAIKYIFRYSKISIFQDL